MSLDRKTLLHLSPLADIGGCEVNCLRVIQGLPEHGHRVLVFDRQGPMAERWEAAGARLEYLGGWDQGAPAFREAFGGWAARQPPPDGVFYWSTSRLPDVLAVLRGWPSRACVYLGNPVAPGAMPGIRRWLQERQAAPGAAVTLAACSDQVAASHRRSAYFRRFSMEVVHNAVSPDFDQARAHRPLPPASAPRIGMVARLDVIKDHAAVLRSLAAIAPSRPDVVAEFAGDGGLRASLEEEARRLGVADRVRFLGFADVRRRLQDWDIYVHSTTAAEGMGTAVAEAMMSGLPCLVSDLPVMREVCGEEGARYFRAGDPAALGRVLIEMIEDPARRAALGAAAQRRAREMFALNKVAAAYLRLVSPAGGKGLP